MTVDLHRTITEQLGRSRQRYTHGRRRLIDALIDAGRPVTISELQAQGVTQSQSSLYRNLAILEQCGAVHRVSTSDDLARYELAEELSEHHHHVVCGACGRVEDVTLPAAIEQALGHAADEARRQCGYAVDSHRLEFVGTCEACT